MTYTHLFLGVLLVPFVGLVGAQGPCPTPCHCTSEILNCSRITNQSEFHQVPLHNPAASLHPFMHLDFTGNLISSIGEEVWKAYPWTEHLVLKDNSLSRLQNTSLEGLLFLTYLDLSCNKIQIIGRNTFEAVPLLQVINLSGNIIQQIAYGTFQAWHGMQFLFKIDLSHNPLAVVQDSFFYGLPSLRFLDFGATDITSKILEDLLQNSLQLRILILPQTMSCCLCRIKENIEVLCETIKLGCPESCATNATLCDTEEPLMRMQKEVMKKNPAYGKKWFGAVLVIAIIMNIITDIYLAQICFRHSAAKRKKISSDLEGSRTESQLTNKPLWLQDMYQEQDETQKNSMVAILHDEESSAEVDIVGKGSARSSLAEASMKKVSSKALSVPTEEKPPPPPAASTAKKDADKGAAAEEGDDEEESGEKSEAPTTEATGESDEEEEEEEDD